MKKSCLAAALLVLCSCAADPVMLTEKFDAEQAGKQMKEGKNTIEGSALWREKNGHVQTCAGYQVTLYPATKYAEERIKHQYGNAERGGREITKQLAFIPDEEQFYKLSKKTFCDVEGKFLFEDVADGDYYAVTKIVWGNPDDPEDQTEGGTVMSKLSVKGGKKIKIVLSQSL